MIDKKVHFDPTSFVALDLTTHKFVDSSRKRSVLTKKYQGLLSVTIITGHKANRLMNLDDEGRPLI